jgi:hypothetical protein
MLHLFSERAHAFELATGGREGIFVFWHSIGGGNELFFHAAKRAIQYFSYGAGLGRLIGLRPGDAATGDQEQECEPTLHLYH